MEFVRLTKRLQTVADLVTRGNVVADIGTDHGYLPIYLIQNNITPRVIGMDVNKGPLGKALENITYYQVDNQIDLRLSDGLMQLHENEAQTITICGMGGKLIAKILENSKDKIVSNQELILSPQSELQQFREFLFNNKFHIINEEMITDDGKFYVIIKCQLCLDDNDKMSLKNTHEHHDLVQDVYLKFGKHLLENRNLTLKQFLIKEKDSLLAIRNNLEKLNSSQVEVRMKEIDYELRCIEEGLKFYEM